MERPSRPYSWQSLLFFAGVGGALVVTQTGCPGGAELENADAWAGRLGASTGGTSSQGGSGGSPAAGTGGGGLDPATICTGGLNAKTVIDTTCGKTGCHKAGFPAGGLDLTWATIVEKTKDVPATHTEILCPPDFTECLPTTCPTNALLVDSTNVEASWLLAKIRETHNGCGDAMPSAGFSTSKPAEFACVEAVVRAIGTLPK